MVADTFDPVPQDIPPHLRTDVTGRAGAMSSQLNVVGKPSDRRVGIKTGRKLLSVAAGCRVKTDFLKFIHVMTLQIAVVRRSISDNKQKTVAGSGHQERE